MGWPQRSLSGASGISPPQKVPEDELEAIALDVPGRPRPGRSRHLPRQCTAKIRGRDGQVVKRFAPTTKPQDLTQEIEALLK